MAELIVGKNDLLSQNPEVAKEWDYEKNDMRPQEFAKSSNKKVWWKCQKCGHSWHAQINSRTRGNGCPECGKEKSRKSRLQSRIDKNGSLADLRPDLAKQWNYKRNNGVLPTEVTKGDNKKYWWICAKGHEWESSVNSRSRSLYANCPVCNAESKTSFPEQAILYYFSKFFKVQNRFLFLGKEIDVYLEELNIGIEYDGKYFHSSEKKIDADLKKEEFLVARGVKLFRVKESDENKVEGNIVFYTPTYSTMNLENAIHELFQLIDKSLIVDINILRDSNEIYQQYIQLEKENSIATQKPELLEEWNYEKNGLLKPEYISYMSGKKVWWKCKDCGYEWQAVISSRYVGNGCKACAGQILVVGKNDLLSQNPSLALEWDYEKNSPLKPDEITVNNGKKVWWICKDCGNNWKATIAHRNNGRICPKCAKEKVIKTRLANKRDKEGTLATNYPDVAKEWNYEKNGDLIPEKMTAHSGQKVWWICSTCKTEWEAYISNRVKGHGCPNCFKKIQAERSVRTAFKRNGSVAESNPEILEVWNYRLNTEIKPENVTKGSHTKIWCLCPTCGNEWQAMVANLVKGQRCPACSKTRKRKVLQIDLNDNIIAEFESSAEAERVTGISKSSVSQAANGKKKTAGGYRWRFKDEY